MRDHRVPVPEWEAWYTQASHSRDDQLLRHIASLLIEHSRSGKSDRVDVQASVAAITGRDDIPALARRCEAVGLVTIRRGRYVKPTDPEPARDQVDLTPVELRDGIWYKRDDLYSFAGVSGGKVRTCVALATRTVRPIELVTAGARQSPQVNIVARVAAALDMKAICHVPAGSETPELVSAREAGATIIRHRPGYNSVIVAAARRDALARPGCREIPFGMECEEAVTQTRAQVANLPWNDILRIVVPVGSGMSLAGILWGLKDQGMKSMPVLGVVVGADPIRRLERYAPHDWHKMVKLVAAVPDYHTAVHNEISGITLDPIYEAKCLPYIRPGDILWIVGIRRTVATTIEEVLPLPTEMPHSPAHTEGGGTSIPAPLPSGRTTPPGAGDLRFEAAMCRAHRIRPEDESLLLSYFAEHSVTRWPRFYMSPTYLAQGQFFMAYEADCLLILKKRMFAGHRGVYLILPPMHRRSDPTIEVAALRWCLANGMGAKLTSDDVAIYGLPDLPPDQGNIEYIYSSRTPFTHSMKKAKRRMMDRYPGSLEEHFVVSRTLEAEIMDCARRWQKARHRHGSEVAIARHFCEGSREGSTFRVAHVIRVQGVVAAYSLSEHIAPNRVILAAGVRDYDIDLPDPNRFLQVVDIEAWTAARAKEAQVLFNIGAAVHEPGLIEQKESFQPIHRLQIFDLKPLAPMREEVWRAIGTTP